MCNEYLAPENRILKAHLPSRLRLSDAERSTLAEIAKRLGRKALKDVARVAKPDTLLALAWYRRLVAHRFDGSWHRAYPGRPRVSFEVEALVVRFARENRGWGYDPIVGALANLGHQIPDQPRLLHLCWPLGGMISTPSPRCSTVSSANFGYFDHIGSIHQPALAHWLQS